MLKTTIYEVTASNNFARICTSEELMNSIQYAKDNGFTNIVAKVLYD